MSTLDVNASPGASAWAVATEMSDMEAMFWRAESDARLRSDGVMLNVLDCTPDFDRLVAGHEWGTRLVPRLRQRVVEDPLRLRPPSWVSTDLDMGYHLGRIRLGEHDDFSRVLDIASFLHMTPFDTARPLWQAILVDGLADGRAAYLLKLHHSMADGQGAMQLFEMLYSQTREPSKRRGPVGGTGPSEVDNPATAAVRRGAGLARGSVDVASRVVSGVGGTAARTLRDPGAALAYAQSLSRMTKTPGTPSPLFRTRGLSRRLRILEVPLADLRAGGKAASGSLNDAYMAGLLGGLGQYHRLHSVEVGDLPTALPVSLRTGEDSAGGNRFAAANIAGPAGERDPATRIKLIRERVRRARDEPALDFLSSAALLTSRLPGHMLASLSLKMANSLDLQASNIPGMTRKAYLAGAEIERMYCFGPVPGCAIMAVMLSHAETCCITLATDNDAVPDPDLLLECVQKGFAEIVALDAS